jgi:hypothetical protein
MSPEDITTIIQKYRSKGLLIDTNLLLLYFIGHAVPEIQATFKPLRNRGFTQEDFERLNHLVALFSRVVTTPHILTEVSNHCDKLKGRHRSMYGKSVVPLIKHLNEERIASSTLCECDGFVDFGLTDTAISEVSRGKYLVLTADFPLYGHLKKRRVDVINYNHLRYVT